MYMYIQRETETGREPTDKKGFLICICFEVLYTFFATCLYSLSVLSQQPFSLSEGTVDTLLSSA